MTRNLLTTIALLLLPTLVWAQQERADIRSGNRSYHEGKYPEAEVGYRRALEKNITSYEANFNLGGSLYKQGRYEDASASYQKLTQDGSDPLRQSATYYNLGNTLVKQRKLAEAIEAYKNSLRLVPEDKEAKFNLAYAKKLKQEEDKKNQDDQQNKDNNQDQNQNKDQNNSDQDKKNDQNQNQDNKDNNQDKDKNDPNQDQNKNDDKGKDKEERQPPQQQPSSTREESERLLKAIQASEDNTKKKVEAEKAQAIGSRGGKEW